MCLISFGCFIMENGLYYLTIHDPTIRVPTIHDSRINNAFLCKGGNSLHCIEKLKSLKIGFIYLSLKLRTEKVKYNFFLMVRTLCHHHSLLVYRINLCNSQSQLSCQVDSSQLYRHNNRHNNYHNFHISRACSGKCTYDVAHNQHTLMPVISLRGLNLFQLYFRDAGQWKTVTQYVNASSTFLVS